VLRRALDLKKNLGDRFGVAEAYRYLGQLEIELGEYEAGEQLLGQALSIHQALGTPFNIGAVHTALGVVKLFTRDYEASKMHGEKALDIFKRTGDQIAASHALMNLGELAINRGEIAQAQSMLRESRRMKESMGSHWAVFDIRNHLAMAAMWLGEFADAERLLGETLNQVDAKGTGEDRAVARSLMGLLRCFQSRLQLAALELGRSRADAEDLGTRRVTVFCQANAAFYAGLTEADATFEQLVNQVKGEQFFYTLQRDIWLELISRLATQTAERDRDRQSVRLLHTAARFAEAFQDRKRYDKLIKHAKQLDEQLKR
jgi:tetratricopeptide (TPR) repeat protein